MNVFVTILNESLNEVKAEMALQSNEYEIVDFIVKKVKSYLGKSDSAPLWFQLVWNPRIQWSGINLNTMNSRTSEWASERALLSARCGSEASSVKQYEQTNERMAQYRTRRFPTQIFSPATLLFFFLFE